MRFGETQTTRGELQNALLQIDDLTRKNKALEEQL